MRPVRVDSRIPKGETNFMNASILVGFADLVIIYDGSVFMEHIRSLFGDDYLGMNGQLTLLRCSCSY